MNMQVKIGPAKYCDFIKERVIDNLADIFRKKLLIEIC